MSAISSRSRPAGRRQAWFTLAMAAAVLLPSLYGFGSKFVEFVALASGEVDGAFAIAPVVNYLLASLGFLCLFGWAAANGMFHDVERPKLQMLDNERLLDARESRWQGQA
jgi:hypothetical protein